MKRPFLLLLTILARPAAAAEAPAFSVDAPRTYGGVLPCADCEGTRWTLNLSPDRSFVLRLEFLGKSRASVDLGTWSVGDDGKLELKGGTEGPQFLRPVGDATLRKLDVEGRDIESRLNYDLKREAAFRLIEDPVRLQGLYSYMADAGRMKVCLTGQSLPVAKEGDNAALEAAYPAARKAPAEPVLATVTAHFAERPKVEGAGKDTVLVVEKFERFWPGDPCPPPPASAKKGPGPSPLGKTWKLVSLRGQPVAGGSGRRAPKITFGVDGRRLTGSTGCNRLTARYTLKDDGLRISGFATSRKACPDGGVQERAVLGMLEEITSWRIAEGRLLLYSRKTAIAELALSEDD